MAQTEVRLGPQGRLVIPAAIRRALGLETGARLLARAEEGRLVLESPASEARRLRGAWRRFADHPERVLDELETERRAEAEMEAAEAAGDAAAIAEAHRRLSRH
ncbi:MAG: AbrB/MazE/SpoVT family DNA-binding domain-containing protein [Candidatus Dormibacteria bacterium]